MENPPRNDTHKNKTLTDYNSYYSFGPANNWFSYKTINDFYCLFSN